MAVLDVEAPFQASSGQPSRRPRGVSAAAVLVLGAVVWGLKLGLHPLDDNSFLTHLAAGRLILHSGIPRVDPFSSTALGTPWVVQSWLVAALYGVAERL